MISDSQSSQGAEQPIDEVPESDAASASAAAAVDELEALREESARNYAGWQRAQADFENLKRRSAQDVRDRVQQSQRAILLDLIELADDFERANREVPAEDASADDPWRQGVELISQKLDALLLRQQVQQIETVDQPFDPEYHEAVGQLPGRHNEIVAVLRTGYTVGNRILRASQVMVGDGSNAAPETADEETK
ncbi:MAG: nucleotide exchange factor GrpE [Chloroflexi bacterium]|nr:nucleotide exchange factor GrpE [Chloroflexota bacterium]